VNETYSELLIDTIQYNQAELTLCDCNRWRNVDCISETVVHNDGGHRICVFKLDNINFMCVMLELLLLFGY